MTIYSDAVKVLSFSSKTDDFLIGKSRDGKIKLWNFQSWDVKQELPEPESYDVTDFIDVTDVAAFTFSENGQCFAIGDSTGSITIWQQPDTARPLHTFKSASPDSASSVKVLLFLPFLPKYDYENRHIVSANNDSKIVLLWDLNSEASDKTKPIREFILDTPEVESEKITALAFLNHRELLVAGTSEGNIYLWDNKESGPIVNSSKLLKKHYSSITALAAADGGTILVSVSDDGIIIRSEGTDFDF